jgi:cell pole-organizing protein PopZ
MEAHELLRPPPKEDTGQSREQARLRQIARLIKEKKRALQQAAGDSLDDLISQIIRLHSD